MSDIYDDLDGEVSASEVIKYWKDMYRKMASLNDELYTRIEALEGFCELFVNAYPDWRDKYETLEKDDLTTKEKRR